MLYPLLPQLSEPHMLNKTTSGWPGKVLHRFIVDASVWVIHQKNGCSQQNWPSLDDLGFSIFRSHHFSEKTPSGILWFPPSYLPCQATAASCKSPEDRVLAILDMALSHGTFLFQARARKKITAVRKCAKSFFVSQNLPPKSQNHDGCPLRAYMFTMVHPTFWVAIDGLLNRDVEGLKTAIEAWWKTKTIISVLNILWFQWCCMHSKIW